jgi:GNAT domain-containint protein
MTLERCRESMQQALDFFPRYFPDASFAGFACGSWILNPQLEQIYRPDSNMVLWQRELYLFPVPSGDRSGVYFIFGTDDVDPRSALRDTSLRRALLDHIDRGGRLIGGGMFLLAEDFAQFGTQHYRSQPPVAS